MMMMMMMMRRRRRRKLLALFKADCLPRLDEPLQSGRLAKA